jgi:hypothetical protein
MVQGAVVADLVSLWIAGHVVRDQELGGRIVKPDTDAYREDTLQEFTTLIRQLVPVSEQEILERIKAGTEGSA